MNASIKFYTEDTGYIKGGAETMMEVQQSHSKEVKPGGIPQNEMFVDLFVINIYPSYLEKVRKLVFQRGQCCFVVATL